MKNEIDKNIFEAFLNNKVKGLNEDVLPEHIETQISDVFLFPQKVYKIYKKDNDIFNKYFVDLAKEETRRNFYKNDFSWNHYFNKNVYLSLLGIHVLNDQVIINDDIFGCHDLLIEMNRINTNNNLTNLLHEKKLTEKDFFNMGYQMTKAIDEFPNKPVARDNFYDNLLKRQDDLSSWLSTANHSISQSEADEVVGVLKKYIAKHKQEFFDFPLDQLSIAIDNHSDNIFYGDDKVSFIDIYPPKEDWLLEKSLLSIYRPYVDIFILQGESFAQALLEGYKKHHGFLDEKHSLYYILYSAIIQCVSLFNLAQKNESRKSDALKYWQFINDNYKNLK